MAEADIAKLIEEMSNSFSAELKAGFKRLETAWTHSTDD